MINKHLDVSYLDNNTLLTLSEWGWASHLLQRLMLKPGVLSCSIPVRLQKRVQVVEYRSRDEYRSHNSSRATRKKLLIISCSDRSKMMDLDNDVRLAIAIDIGLERAHYDDTRFVDVHLIG